jgi:FkbM family methyltransferase
MYTLFAAKRVGPEGMVLAFEPSAREFRQLEQNVARNRLENVRCLPYALAERDGEAGLKVAEYEHSGVNTLGAFVHPGVDLESTDTVSLRRLDGIAAELGLSRLDFLKMDVEGAEARVLQGAESLLARFRPLLLLEVNDSALRQQASSAEQLLCTLRKMNYRLYTFDPGSGLPVPGEGSGSGENLLAWPGEKPFSG